MRKKRIARVKRAEIDMPVNLWRRLRHAAIDHDTSASELVRRGAQIALAYVDEVGELPPSRPGLARKLARSIADGGVCTSPAELHGWGSERARPGLPTQGPTSD